ncbi:MAG: alpha/beta hydrolase [Rhodobacteraceae bacterium]|nr:alpha/beta hydrolase [Paracoccaceae bacterium]MBO27717.1 alpha/beta hydrolase [Paracoccaceae bacterium]
MNAPRSETREIGGHPFHIRHWGDPALPKLLMLHGFPEYGGAWGNLAPLLAERFHCIAPDQRGYGQSWAPEDVSEYTTSKLVGDMAALIGEDAPMAVLGHDWGAAVAYGLAMFRPELVSRLIIMNGVHPAPFQREMAAGGAQSEASQYINYLRRPTSHDELGADGMAKMKDFFQARMKIDWLSEEELAAYVTEWSRPGRLNGMINWYRASPLKIADPGTPLTDLPDLPAEKLQVRCPHLLIWGMEDRALLPASNAGLEDYAPDLTRVEIPGADHWLHHQKPEEVARAILDWMP